MGRIESGTQRKQIGRGFHFLGHTFLSALATAEFSAELRRLRSGHADRKSRTRDPATGQPLRRVRSKV